MVVLVEVLTKVRVFSVFREQAITPIEQMNKVPGKIKIPYLLVEISERPLDVPSIENIGILYNYGPGVRGTKAQRLPSPI